MWNFEKCCACVQSGATMTSALCFFFFGNKEMKRKKRTVIFHSGSACALSCHFIAGFSSEVCRWARFSPDFLLG